MQSDIGKNHYELFGLPVGFDVDSATLTQRYRALQRTAHPDNFASGSERERRISVQRTAQVNDAYETLKDPLARARYLLELKGIDVNAQHASMDEEFLMEQMELREALAEARHSENPQGALMHLLQDVEGRLRTLEGELNEQFAGGSGEQLRQAAETVRKLQFLTRLRGEAGELEDELAMTLGE